MRSVARGSSFFSGYNRSLNHNPSFSPGQPFPLLGFSRVLFAAALDEEALSFFSTSRPPSFPSVVLFKVRRPLRNNSFIVAYIVCFPERSINFLFHQSSVSWKLSKGNSFHFRGFTPLPFSWKLALLFIFSLPEKNQLPLGPPCLYSPFYNASRRRVSSSCVDFHTNMTLRGRLLIPEALPMIIRAFDGDFLPPSHYVLLLLLANPTPTPPTTPPPNQPPQQAFLSPRLPPPRVYCVAFVDCFPGSFVSLSLHLVGERFFRSRSGLWFFLCVSSPGCLSIFFFSLLWQVFKGRRVSSHQSSAFMLSPWKDAPRLRNLGSSLSRFLRWVVCGVFFLLEASPGCLLLKM